jgi:hypothetical protein
MIGLLLRMFYLNDLQNTIYDKRPLKSSRKRNSPSLLSSERKYERKILLDEGIPLGDILRDGFWIVLLLSMQGL